MIFSDLFYTPFTVWGVLKHKKWGINTASLIIVVKLVELFLRQLFQFIFFLLMDKVGKLDFVIKVFRLTLLFYNKIVHSIDLTDF